ncbi:Protein of unknown function (DUF3176) domain containing protein [Naviculisporaceae sp. PSN 640]
MSYSNVNPKFESRHTHSLGSHVTESTPAIGNHHPGECSSPGHSVTPGKALALALRDWAWELAGTVAAATMLVAISLCMSKYNTTKQAEWFINLSTLVAIISTFLRAALVFVVTSILSQLAWNWFDQPHPLSHLDSLHAAAQGRLGGALKLITARIVYVPAIICLVISTATFGVGPFTQQSIRSTPCDDVVLSVGEIPMSNYITAQTYVGTAGPARYSYEAFDYDMEYMFTQGFTTNTANVPRIETYSRCKTGNCTFPTYSSLAICSRCLDVTSDIKSTPDLGLTAFSLPNNSTVHHYVSRAPLDEPYRDRTIVWLQTKRGGRLHDGNEEEWPFNIGDDEFNDAARECPTFTILGLSGHKKENASAAACTLYPCLQTYTGAFKDDKLEEVVTSKIPLRHNDTIYASGETFAVLSPCTISGVTYSFENNFTVPGHDFGVNDTISLNITNQIWNVPLECYFHATQEFMSAWSDFIGGKFDDSNCTVGEDGRYSCDELGFKALVNDGKASFEIYRDVMDNIAKATTTQLRISGKDAATVNGFYVDQWGNLLIHNESLLERGFVQGSGSQMTVCYEIQWIWLAFPAGMVVAVLVLVLSAIVSTFGRRLAGRPVWKSSVLPLLFYGLLPPGSSETAAGSTAQPAPGKKSTQGFETSALQEKASKVVVQLVNGEEGCGFLVVNDARDMGQTQRTEQAEEQQYMRQEWQTYGQPEASGYSDQATWTYTNYGWVDGTQIQNQGWGQAR